MSLTSSIWKYVVVTALLWPGPWCPASLAQSALAGLEPTECEEDPDGKSGLCGHALAAIARMEAMPKLEAGVMAELAEAQAQTDITHCFLDLEVILEGTDRIAASNTLDVRSMTDGLTQFTLDLRSNMVVDAVTVNGTSATYTRPGNQIVIDLPAPRNMGQTFQVRVVYHGTPASLSFFSSPHSFFSPHSAQNSTTIVSTLSQPYYAHYWWPCKENWADMDDKFTMEFHITVPDWMIVASNGSLQGVDTLTSNRKKFRWRESYPIATYLVSFAATNYEKRVWSHNYPGGSMPVEFYIYPESVSASEPFLANIVQAISTYSIHYGPYPFITEKYGIAQFPWCCGMEHQTITSQGQYTVERRNVHELSHMWWGDHVTCKDWHHIWLNEGFATFSEALWQEKRPGGSYSAYLDQMNYRKPPTTGTGTVYRYDISSSDAIFSTDYAYEKAGWVVHMLRHVLGDTTFFNALGNYRAAYAGAAATTEDFRAICESTAELPPGALNWFFDQWVYNTGIPRYRYGWQQATIAGQNWVRLHVEQYQKASVSAYPNAMKMPIDITINTAGGSQTHVVWNDATGSGNSVTEWFLLPASAAVTSVQFDKDTWILWRNVSTATYVNGPPKLVSTVPAPGATVPLGQTVSAIELQFSEPITASASDFLVSGSVSGSRAFTFNYNASTYKVTLLFASPLAGGETWTVRVADTLRSSAASMALDGEVADPNSPASLPSGDGMPGGAAVFHFGTPQDLPPCNNPIADLDGDDDVDMDDFGAIQACFTGKDDPANAYNLFQCHCADRDGDWDVDDVDMGVFLQCISGPEIPAGGTCDDTWVAFADDFDAGTSAARWVVFGSSSDHTEDFAFDYGALGIPPAPHSSGGTTTGLKFTVNKNDATGAIAAVSAFPIGGQFSGNYTLSFDMWINYVGTAPGVGTTEMMNVGINAPATQVIWPSNPGNGYFAAVTGDGDDSNGWDYRLYRGGTMLTVSSGVYAAGTASNAQDSANAFYQALFPKPPATIAGTPGKQWVFVELSQQNGVVTWKLNGTVIATLSDTTYTSGNIMMGYMDLFASIPSPKTENYVIYDNIVVTQFE